MACLHEINIRLTNFCNETCDHCVYRSSPKFNTHLTSELSEQINKWFPKSNNKNICMFGGELTLIPHYPELVKNLCKKLDQAGMITNGVFVNKKEELDKFIDMVYSVSMRMFNFTIRVSQSEYHSPKKYGLKAFNELTKTFKKSNNIHIQLAGRSNHPIIPFGRAFDNNVYITSWAEAMCESAIDRNIFIDENGIVHLCPMGSSPYKYFWEDDFFNMKGEILDWRNHRIKRGMDCLSCSKFGIGYCKQDIVPLRIESKIKCSQGGFSGVLV